MRRSSFPGSLLLNTFFISFFFAGWQAAAQVPTKPSATNNSRINVSQVSGIINHYTEVLSFENCTNEITVSDAANYEIGDTVLLIQMKGAIIDTSNTSSFGTITDYRSAGNYEFNYIKNKIGNVLELLNVVERPYNIPDGKVQLVRVPFFENLDVTGDVTCLPWDGSKGGIVAVNVQNMIVLNGNIDVSGKGFRGGNPLNLTNMHCNKTDYYYPASNNDGGEKGEAIAEISSGKMFGRGALANGGGGGNSHNSGGAGGGNAGAGGRGGNQYGSLSTCGTPILDIGGRPGKTLAYSNASNKIFLGGGGGVGHANELTDKVGGAGGGIVLINAGAIQGNRNAIKANGGSVVECVAATSDCANDGHSGGGAGGSILLSIGNFLDSIQIKAKGGKGADAWFFSSSFTTTGPGAGGGGGLIWYSHSNKPAGIADTVSGGKNGVAVQQNNEAWGATPGDDGISVFNLELPIDDNPFKQTIVSAGNDTTLCEGAVVSLYASGTVNYSWSPATSLTDPNIADPLASPNATTQYVVTGTDPNGCFDTDTINININPAPEIGLTSDTIICKNSSVQLTASGGVNYTWSPSATLSNPSIPNPMASPSNTTLYFVNVTGSNTCTKMDSVLVTIRPDPIFGISPNISVCGPGSTQLLASGGDVYTWQPSATLSDPGIANPIATPQSTTSYSVTITATTCNVTQTFSTTVSVVPRPTLQITKSNNIDCTSPQSQLSATGASTYSWTPATHINNSLIPNPIVTPLTNTWYKVEGTDINGCGSIDSVLVLSDMAAGKAGFHIPTAFTPNNDGKNDCFGVRYWGHADFFELTIFNRWGQKVFHTNNIMSCWDGTFKGKKQVSDVFVYQIRISSSCSNGLLYKKGQVTLIR